jgi:hypothetical protein
VGIPSVAGLGVSPTSRTVPGTGTEVDVRSVPVRTGTRSTVHTVPVPGKEYCTEYGTVAGPLPRASDPVRNGVSSAQRSHVGTVLYPPLFSLVQYGVRQFVPARMDHTVPSDSNFADTGSQRVAISFIQIHINQITGNNKPDSRMYSTDLLYCKL